MQSRRKQRRGPHGSAWHWKQTDSWYFTQPGTKKRVALFDEDGRRVRGKENKEAAELALARERLCWETEVDGPSAGSGQCLGQPLSSPGIAARVGRTGRHPLSQPPSQKIVDRRGQRRIRVDHLVEEQPPHRDRIVTRVVKRHAQRQQLITVAARRCSMTCRSYS